MKKSDSKNPSPQRSAEKPVSLHPLKFKEAVGALLEVDPETIRKNKPETKDEGNAPSGTQ